METKPQLLLAPEGPLSTAFSEGGQGVGAIGPFWAQK